MKKSGILLSVAIAMLIGCVSCEDFLNPDQELKITEDKLFDDWYEYRAIEMGLYGLQQELVEQLMILGELRGDLMDITDNADADMVEIYNFNVSRENKYASPTKFFKLITSCNNLIKVMEDEHPEVLDHSISPTNYDRLYGEALCMRAWTYFNAVRIYGKVPFIPERITGMEEVDAFINSSQTYTDSIHIIFNRDGYHNDTTARDTVLEKQYFDTDMIIDHFTEELENKVKAVGVNHYIENNDESWEITVWGNFSMHALLGHMYLTRGNLAAAAENFEYITHNTSESYRYHIDDAFIAEKWREIFQDIDNREHIYTVWFNKENFQQNRFQEFFEPFGPHKYMLKPSYPAIFKWETVWRGQGISINTSNPQKTYMYRLGVPTDFYRGFGSSYLYVNNGVPMDEQDYIRMFSLRAEGDVRNSEALMENMDTIVYKYSIEKDIYDQDANYNIYRAAGIHLYLAEIYTYRVFWRENGQLATYTDEAVGYLNDGRNYNISTSRKEIGVRGRVGLANGYSLIDLTSIKYIHDPYTNKIISYINLEGRVLKQQQLFEEDILDERARELAFEGERFYDLMRVAKRRNDPSFLAKAVAAKYPSGKREEIEALLMDENNWYINYFE